MGMTLAKTAFMFFKRALVVYTFLFCREVGTNPLILLLDALVPVTPHRPSAPLVTASGVFEGQLTFCPLTSRGTQHLALPRPDFDMLAIL
jgi:hypothetical protein